MNFYSVAAKVRRAVAKEAAATEKILEQSGVEAAEKVRLVSLRSAKVLQQQIAEVEATMDLGIELLEMFRGKLAVATGSEEGRWMMVTVRPPREIRWELFKSSVESFVAKWSRDWSSWEYAFEQKGTSEQTMGHGFHVHLIVCTNKKNYYKSHVLRDATRHFSFVAANCIQVDALKNVAKARSYIRGEKELPDKLAAVAWDQPWRDSLGLPGLTAGGVKSSPPGLQE